MMSVKHIALSGEESIYLTSHVNFVPSGMEANLSKDHEATLWIYDADGRAMPLTGGMAYVMNDHGNTIARYGMGADQHPE